jgi:hypothetical protein
LFAACESEERERHKKRADTETEQQNAKGEDHHILQFLVTEQIQDIVYVRLEIDVGTGQMGRFTLTGVDSDRLT